MAELDPAKIQQLVDKGLVSQETAAQNVPAPMIMEHEETQLVQQARDASLALAEKTAQKANSPIRQYLTDVTIGEHEKGFQNAKQDSGNYVDGKLVGTNFGISAPILKSFLGRTPTEEDMKSLTKEQAVDIYEKQFFKRSGIDKLPESIQKATLDFAINSGPKKAIMKLQKTLGVVPSGIIGPETLEAIDDTSVDKYVDERIKFFKNIVKHNPSQKRFLKGWLKRAESFRLRK